VGLYLYSPNTPSWRGAHLRKAQGQLYLYASKQVGLDIGTKETQVHLHFSSREYRAKS